MDELRPCPFCGGEAELIDYEYGDDCATAWGCGCETCFIYFSGKDTAAESIEAWNTRYERTCEFTYELGDDGWWWYCSNCGVRPSEYDLYNVPNFCPDCGARVIS